MEAAALVDEALSLYRETGHQDNIADAACTRGEVALAQADLTLAASFLAEGLRLYQTLNHRTGSARALYLSGLLASRCRESKRARTLISESLKLRRQVAPDFVAESLEGLAELGNGGAYGEEATHEQRLRAAQLWGAASAARERFGTPLPPSEQETRDLIIAAAARQIDVTAWSAAWEKGRAMTLEQAVAYTLQVVPDG